MLTAVAHILYHRKRIVCVEVTRARAIFQFIDGVENRGGHLGLNVLVLILVVERGMTTAAVRLIRRRRPGHRFVVAAVTGRALNTRVVIDTAAMGIGRIPRRRGGMAGIAFPRRAEMAARFSGRNGVVVATGAHVRDAGMIEARRFPGRGQMTLDAVQRG